MPTNILMPALSPTMEKGNLARWLKKEGDKIKSGDIIAEIETDKATMEYEAVDEGTLAKIVVPEGTQDVAVNAVIAVLAVEGEDVKAAASGAKSAPATKVPEKKTESVTPTPQPSPPRGEGVPQSQPQARSTSPQGGEVGARSAPGEGARAEKKLVRGRGQGPQIEFSPRRSRAAWRRTRTSISIACRALVRMAG